MQDYTNTTFNNSTFDAKKYEREVKTKETIRKVIIYFFLIVWALLVLFPFYWMVLTSIKSQGVYNAEKVPALFTLTPTLENYSYVLSFSKSGVHLLKYMLNTVIFALATTAAMLLVTISSAFAFARLNFKGKEILFTLFLSLMMIPNELVIITNYVTIVNLDWRNTFQGLILPSVASVFYIYLLRENFAAVPDTLYHAAKVDGTSDFKYLTKILIPMCKPTIVSIIILKLIECWNSFVWPRLITTNESFYLVSNGIQEIKENGLGRSNVPGMMAAVVIISIPLIAIFLIFRKQIMTGVSKSGTKG